MLFARVWQAEEPTRWEPNPESGAVGVVGRSVWRAALFMARGVSRSYWPPAAPVSPATYKFPAGNRRRASPGRTLVPSKPSFVPRERRASNERASKQSFVRLIFCVRRSQAPAICGGDRLVRSAPADWPARCPRLPATPVPNESFLRS